MSSLSRYEKNPKVIKQWMDSFADQMVWPEWQKTLLTKFVDTKVVVDYGDIAGPKNLHLNLMY